MIYVPLKCRSVLLLLLVMTAGCNVEWTKWRSNAVNAGIASSITAGNTVVWTNPDGNLESAAAISKDGLVYFGSTNGRVIAADGKTGVTKFSFSTGAPVLSSPAIGRGTVYVGCENGTLYALQEKDLQLKWTATTRGAIRSSPLVSGERVFVGSTDGKVYAFQFNDGTLLWSFQTGGPVLSSPALDPDGILYIGSDDHLVYAVDSLNGNIKWRFATGGVVRASPVYSVLTKNVYVGSDDKNFYAIRPDGSALWSVTTDAGLGDPRYSAALVDKRTVDRIFFGNDNGSFFLYESSTTAKALVASTRIASRVLTAPVAADNGESVIIGTLGEMLRLNVQGGGGFNQTRIRTFDPRILGQSPSVNSDGMIFIANGSGMNAIQ